VSVEEKKYRISNPSQTGRTLLIEHPNRTNLKYKLVETEKPVEDTPEFYRFQTTVKAGEKKSFMVKEQLDVEAHVRLSNSPEIEIRYFLTLTQITPQLKEKLNEVLKLRASWDASRQELKQLLDDLSRLQTDQDRIRKNLRETPKEAEVYGTYLKKLSDQEKELDQIAVQRKKLTDEEFNARKTYEEFLANISD
jgi:septal ring factor EnvC (AmiA/AmiB activator)